MIDFIESDPVFVLGLAAVIFIWSVLGIACLFKIAGYLKQKAARDEDDETHD